MENEWAAGLQNQPMTPDQEADYQERILNVSKMLDAEILRWKEYHLNLNDGMHFRIIRKIYDGREKCL